MHTLMAWYLNSHHLGEVVWCTWQKVRLEVKDIFEAKTAARFFLI